MRARAFARDVSFGLTVWMLISCPHIKAHVNARESQQVPENISQLQQSLQEARKLIQSGRYSEAEEYGRDLLKQFEKNYGVDSLLTAQALDIVVEARFRGGKAGERESRELGKRAVAIKEKLLGPEDPEVAASVYNYAVLFAISGEYEDAKPLFERALSIREEALGPDHPLVGASLNGLANALRHIGDYKASRAAYERALAIREKALGVDNPGVAAILDNLGNLLLAEGDYVAAKANYERALEIRERSLGFEHPLVARNLSNLGNLLLNMGETEEARRCHERALKIREKVLDPEHPDVARSLHNLAEVLRRSGDYDRARQLYEQALLIKENVWGTNSPHLSTTLNGLADVHRLDGRFETSKQLYERALTILETSLPAEHPSLARSMYFLAHLLLDTKDYSKATSLFERCEAVWSKAYGPDHPNVAEALAGLAQAKAESGEVESAIEAALLAETISREHLRLTVRTLPERQAMRFAAVRESGLHLALSLVSRDVDVKLRFKTWDALTRSRAVMLDEMAARHRTVSGATDIVRLAQELVAAQQKLANLTVRGSYQHPAERYRRLFEEARVEKERAEQALAEKSVTFQDEQARSLSGLAEVTKALTRDTALVAFAKYNHNVKEATSTHQASAQQRSSASYLAFILREGAMEPEVAPIGTANEVEALINTWREQIDAAAVAPLGSETDLEGTCRQAGDALRQKVWDPISRHLLGISRVFVVPDGALNLVNLAALPIRKNEFLVETGPLTHYLSAERDLLRQTVRRTRGKGVLVVGAPSFDETSLFAELTTGDKAPSARDRTAAAMELGFRGGRSACADFESMVFEPLSGAAREAEEVANLWSTHETREQSQVVHLSGAGASESAIKTMAPGQRTLHVATHGFFLSGRCPSSLGSVRGVGGLVSGEEPPLVTGENPLLLSGLALAGANHRLAARPDEDDGILTAEEIASLDLSGVEWAVLSACDTGMGQIQAGEGVFGLRRAFQVAGARTLIMSLWTIEDESAREWMRALYDARLMKGLGTAKAVREASLHLLQRRREDGKTTHPFYWGGFVAAGDWR